MLLPGIRRGAGLVSRQVDEDLGEEGLDAGNSGVILAIMEIRLSHRRFSPFLILGFASSQLFSIEDRMRGCSDHLSSLPMDMPSDMQYI